MFRAPLPIDDLRVHIPDNPQDVKDEQEVARVRKLIEVVLADKRRFVQAANRRKTHVTVTYVSSIVLYYISEWNRDMPDGYSLKVDDIPSCLRQRRKLKIVF